MARKPFKALGVFPTPAGNVIVRKIYAKKQGTWLLDCVGPHAGLRQLLPAWRPRAPSTRTQITPPARMKKAGEILGYFQTLAPVFYERLAGKSIPIAAPTEVPPAYSTLGDLMKVVDRESESALRAGSVATYRIQAQALTRVLPLDTVLTDLTRDRLQGVVGELSSLYATTTVTNIRNYLRKLLVRAVEDRVLVANPLAKVKVPKPVARRQTIMTRAQRAAVLHEAEARGRDVALLFHLLLGTGVRRSEVLAITWQDVDLEHRLLHIRSSDHFLTKTGNARSVPIPNELFELLSRNVRSTGFVLKPDQPYANCRYRWDFSKVFAAVLGSAGVEWATVHSMRHHYASWALEAGTSLFRLAHYMGHSALETTQRYGHLTPDYAAQPAQVAESAPQSQSA